jgi:chorismate mutase
MLPSSRTSNLAQIRQNLLQKNSALFQTILERRFLCIKIQELKDVSGQHSCFDPVREKEVFQLHDHQLKQLSFKELLAFSLIMEDQAQAISFDSYPNWSESVHLRQKQGDLIEMINPLMIKLLHPELFDKFDLTDEFEFLKDF